MELIREIVICMDMIFSFLPMVIYGMIPIFIIMPILEIIEMVIIFKPLNKVLNKFRRNYIVPILLTIILLMNLIAILPIPTSWEALNLVITVPTILSSVIALIVTMRDIY